MLRNEQQPMLELNLGDPLYHVTCVVASVHLHLDSDPIYGCTDEPPTLVLGWTLSFTIVDHICIYILLIELPKLEVVGSSFNFQIFSVQQC